MDGPPVQRAVPLLTEREVAALVVQRLDRKIYLTDSARVARVAFAPCFAAGNLDQWDPNTVGALWADWDDVCGWAFLGHDRVPQFRQAYPIHGGNVIDLVNEFNYYSYIRHISIWV